VLDLFLSLFFGWYAKLFFLCFSLANVHPWFANVSIDQAAGWTYDFFQQTNIAQAAQATNNPKMYIAETGWPTVRVSSLPQCAQILFTEITCHCRNPRTPQAHPTARQLHLKQTCKYS